MPKIPTRNSAETKKIRQITKRDSIGSSGRRGGRCITSASVGSKASTMASATELTMLTQST